MSIHEQESTPMGEVIDFPGQHQDEPVQATAERLDQSEIEQGQPVAEAELSSDTRREVRPDQQRRETSAPGELVHKMPRPVVVAVRHVRIELEGLRILSVQAWDAATYGDLRKQIRAARAANNATEVRELAQVLEISRKGRVDRMVTIAKLTWKVGTAVVAVIVVVIVLASIYGIFGPLFGADTSISEIWSGITSTFTTSVDVAAFLARWAPWTAAAALAFTGYVVGRNHAELPAWLRTAAEADMDLPIDETTIAEALKALRIPAIRDHFKQGLPLQYLTTARKDGRGTHAVIRLPAGVTADKIARRRDDLATGLHRLAKEVWPTTGAEAGILDLWVADKGALAEGSGPYPLLEDGLTDVFKGVPFGKTLRGQPISAPLMSRNTMTGGMPGQGKSSAARVLMLGAALDPTAELRIWVPDANFDFDAFQPRCSRYVRGAENEKVEEILEHLRELHDEVQERGELLIEHEEAEVTRKLASAGVGLHPLFCLLEEAHVAIQHPKYGAEVSNLLTEIVRLGRKRGIHFIVSTQAPTGDSMPRNVTRNCSNGIAFAVGDHVANDALLGQGAYRSGHRATDLIPGTDKGTAVVKGFSGERSDMVQAYFVSVSRDNDQVTPVIQRAMAAIEKRGGTVPGSNRAAPQPEQRDLLEDLDAVLGDESVPTADVPALLARHAPKWTPYQRMTGKSLRAELAELGIRVPSTGNRYPLDPATVRSNLAKRATADLDADEDSE